MECVYQVSVRGWGGDVCRGMCVLDECVLQSVSVKRRGNTYMK